MFQPRARHLVTPIVVTMLAAAFVALLSSRQPSWLGWLPAWLAGVATAALSAGVVWIDRWTVRRKEQADREQHAVDLLRERLGRRDALPRIGERGGRALALRVHQSITLEPAGLAGDIGTLDPDLPTFVPRENLDGIRAWMRGARHDGGFLLLVGDSSVGKTRLVYEAAREMLHDFAVLAPDLGDGAVVNVVAGATFPLPKLIVWLDELQRFLDGPYLAEGGTPVTATAVRQLLDAPGPVVIIGTLWPSYATELRAGDQRPGTDRAEQAQPPRPRYPLAADILNDRRRYEITVSSFSSTERAAAEAIAERDPRVAEALRDTTYNVTEVLAGAPRLMRRYEQATPRHRAVLNAAVDARRVGIRSPLSAALLGSAARGYLTTLEPSDSWIATTVAELAEPECGIAPLLAVLDDQRRTIVGYDVADYLLQHVAASRTGRPLPAAAWPALIAHTAGLGDAFRLAVNADNRLFYCHAIPLYQRVAAAGNRYAAQRLTQLLAARRAPSGDLVAAFRCVTAAGDAYRERVFLKHDSNETLLERLKKQGRHDVVAAALRSWANAGDTDAAESWAKLMIEQDRIDQAAAIADAQPRNSSWFAIANWINRLLDAGRGNDVVAILNALPVRDHGSYHFYGFPRGVVEHARGWFGQCAGEGRTNDAIGVLRALARFSDEATVMLADALVKENLTEDAIDVLRYRADDATLDWYENDRSAERLADLLTEFNRLPELEARADAGDGWASHRLARLLVEQGRTEDLQARADAGDLDAGGRLVELLLAQDRVAEAFTTLRAMAARGSWTAQNRLLRLVSKNGSRDELLDLIRDRLSKDPNDYAAAHWARSLATEGDASAAELLDGAAAAGSLPAACDLTKLLISQRRTDPGVPLSALRILAADKNSRGTVDDWATFLLENGRVDDAAAALTVLVEAGVDWAAVRLAETFVGAGDVERAATVLRTFQGDPESRMAEQLFESLVSQNRCDETIALVRAVVDNPNCTASTRAHAASRLAKLLAELGRIEDLRAFADADEWNEGALALNRLLEERGAYDELRARADGGDQWAVNATVDELIQQDRLDEAMDVLRAHAATGNEESVDRLAQLRAALIPADELVDRVRHGQPYAAQRLVRLLAEAKATDLLWVEVDAGTPGASEALIKVLASLGHTDQAARLSTFGRDDDEAGALNT